MMILINENQFADMFLNEERHYPQFLDNLKSEVVTDLSKEIKWRLKNKQFKFEVYINVDCQYCYNIYFDVNLILGKDVNNRQNYSATYYNEYNGLYKGKLYKPQITVICPCNGEETDFFYLKYCISHELTHLYDDWMNLKNGENSISLQTVNIQSTEFINRFARSENDLERGVGLMSYMSLKVERQAFLSQTVQELEGIGCDTSNYREKLKETIPYNNITKSYKIFNNGLINSDEYTLSELNNKLIKYYPKSNIPKYDIKVFNPQQYRAKLRRWADNIFHQMMKRYGSVVLYYIDKLNEDYFNYKKNCIFII